MNLDFQRLEHVAGIAGAQKDAAVRGLFDLEFHVQDEAGIGILGP